MGPKKSISKIAVRQVLNIDFAIPGVPFEATLDIRFRVLPIQPR